LVKTLPVPLSGAASIRLVSPKAVIAYGQTADYELFVSGGGQMAGSWDGTNASGTPVSAGTYFLCLSKQNGQSESITVQVLRSPQPDSLAAASFGPNPLRKGQELFIVLPCALPSGVALRAQVFGLSGERIAATSSAGEQLIRLPFNNAAAGVYLLVLEKNAGLRNLERRIVKIAVMK
jgi:hypothetical protein